MGGNYFFKSQYQITALAAVITIGLSMVISIEITPEIQSRTEERPIGIIVAVLLGIAGGLALITAIPIYMALIPPAAVSGIGIGLGSFAIAFSAFLILVSCIIGLIIGFLIIFLAKRVAPRRYLEKKKAQKLVRGNVVILVGLAAALGAIEVIFQ